MKTKRIRQHTAERRPSPAVDTAPAPEPSEYQKRILEAVRSTSDNLMIQACAGSGKTTTLRMICDALPPETRALALCFNKAVADEFGEKLPPHVEAGTFHSVGLKIIRAAVGAIKVNPRKLENLIEDRLDALVLDKKARARRFMILKRMIPLALGTMTNISDGGEALEELAADYGVSTKKDAGWLLDLFAIIVETRRLKSEISFGDMIDHPLWHNYPLPEYDIVLVDETQDLNAQQMEFVRRLANGNRVIAVGDRFQSIYGFRGAQPGAIDIIKKQFGCAELPLSVCYRCGYEIVRSAQEVVGREAILAAPGAAPGRVDRLEGENYQETMASLKRGDMVLCRTNAPLVRPCVELIEAGVPAYVKGRDIGKGLLGLIDQHSDGFHDRDIFAFSSNIVCDAGARQKGLLADNRQTAAEILQDQIEIILVFLEGATSISHVRSLVERVFSEAKDGVCFSSIHKAKGLEAPRVVFLGPELIPHRMAKQLGTQDALDQERNLDYVARTRAQGHLIFQPLPEKS